MLARIPPPASRFPLPLPGTLSQLVSLFFREDNPGTAPKPGYAYAKTNVTAWAVEDLTIYITHFYFSVIYVHPCGTPEPYLTYFCSSFGTSHTP